MPAADEVGHLQRGKDEECRLFQEIAEQGHYAGRTAPTNTRQGIYAASPGGALLASVNSSQPRAVAAMLARALEAWDALPAEARRRPRRAEVEPSRWESRFPEGGLALRVYTRDLPRERPVNDWRARAWNQDTAWFTREEARSFLPGEPVVGATHEVPLALVERIARLHLLDDVRGQTTAFPPGSLERGRIAARVVAVRGSEVEVELEGETRTSHTGRWPVHGHEDAAEPSEQTRGYEASLAGRARFDLEAQAFTSFELVAVGSRWGGTQYNARADDLAPAPMGVVLALAPDGPEARVPPAQIWGYGWRL